MNERQILRPRRTCDERLDIGRCPQTLHGETPTCYYHAKIRAGLTNPTVAPRSSGSTKVAA